MGSWAITPIASERAQIARKPARRLQLVRFRFCRAGTEGLLLSASEHEFGKERSTYENDLAKRNSIQRSAATIRSTSGRAMLLGCGLRRSELLAVTVKTIQRRQAPLSGSPAKRISEKKL